MAFDDNQFHYDIYLSVVVRIEDDEMRRELADCGESIVAELSALRHLIKTKDEQIETLRDALKRETEKPRDA